MSNHTYTKKIGDDSIDLFGDSTEDFESQAFLIKRHFEIFWENGFNWFLILITLCECILFAFMIFVYLSALSLITYWLMVEHYTHIYTVRQ